MLVTCPKCSRQVDCGDAPAGTRIVCPCGGSLTIPKTSGEASSINCPSCGAPVDPEAGRCTYCSSKLATIVCPRCFGTIYVGEKHCSHCGEQITDRLNMQIGEESHHRCPRCSNRPALFVHMIFGYPLERCLSCDGLWVDRETVERVYTERAKQDLVRQKINENKRKSSVLSPGIEGYFPCPVCKKFMNRKNFGQISGVLIDQCRDHGTWFDADELSKILLFISDGGLHKVAERNREIMEEQLRQRRREKQTDDHEYSPTFAGNISDVGQVDDNDVIRLFGKVMKSLFEF